MTGVRIAAGCLATLCGLYAAAYAVFAGSSARPDPEWSAAGRGAAHHISGPANFSLPEPPEVGPGVMRRRVLALYAAPDSPADNPVHRNAELVLNHLGLVVDYHDVDRALPDDVEMAPYRGVLVWTGDRCRDPAATLTWYAAQVRAGRRVVLVDGLGCARDLEGRPVDPKTARLGLAGMGVDLGPEASWDGGRFEVVAHAGRRTAFERPLDSRVPYWRDVRATAADAKVWLRLGQRGRADRPADAVFTHAGGGFVMSGYAVREQEVAGRFVRRWQIDPFAFFAEALGVPPDAPRLDFTTLNGSRLFYAHIDGDGMEQLSEVDRRKTCGELVTERLVDRYDLPVTASVVVGRVQPPPHAFGSDRELAVARALFARPNVEVASHGYSHPLDWRDPDAAPSVPGLPDHPVDGAGEIARSAAYIDAALAPAGKPTRLMLWTGWCNPSAEQLQVTYDLGLYNLNGGDGRMDRLFPSYAHLAPPTRRVGGLLQFHTSAANDYILTDEWRPPYYRFANIVDTFENSGAPRRVLPANVYFHFYIARKPASLAGVKAVYEWALRQDLAPVFASEYLDGVRGFIGGRVERAGPGTWRVSGDPGVRTLRFDGAPVEIDLERSRGVLGYLWLPAVSATYVHLARPDALVVMGDAPPTAPYLRQASHRVSAWRVAEGGVRLTMHGVGRKKLWLGGVADGAYAVRVDGAPVETVRAADGRLAAAFDGNGAVAVEVNHR